MDYRKAIQNLQRLKAQLPTLVGNEMVNYALDNMKAEAFDGRAWQRRKPGAVRNQGRKLLVDTGTGRRSIRWVKQGNVVAVEMLDYMAAHNEGEHGTYPRRSRRGSSGNQRKTTGTGLVHMNLPQRQFIGVSPVLFERINRTLSTAITNALT